MDLKKILKEAFAIGALAIAPLFSNGQEIYGYVTNDKGESIPNAVIKATPEDDLTKTTTITTGSDGAYTVNVNDIITGIEDLDAFGKEEMTITHQGSRMILNVTSKTPLKTANIINMKGGIIANRHSAK